MSDRNADVLELVRGAITKLQQAEQALVANMPPAEDRMGEVAHRHLEILEATGELTVDDSRKIRRELYGSKMRSTANLFGRSGEKALFYRVVDHGTRTDESQQVRLTPTGIERAQLYREAHGLAD